MEEPLKIELNKDESLMLLRTLLAARGLPFKVVAKPDVSNCEELIAHLKTKKGHAVELTLSSKESDAAWRAIRSFLKEYHEEGAVHAHTGFTPDDLTQLSEKLAHGQPVAR